MDSVPEIVMFALSMVAICPEGIFILSAVNVPVWEPIMVPLTLRALVIAQVTIAVNWAMPDELIVRELQELATLMLTVMPAQIMTSSATPGVVPAAAPLQDTVDQVEAAFQFPFMRE